VNQIVENAKKGLYLNFVYEDRYKFLVEGFLMTLGLTLATFILGTLLGALLCRLMFARNRRVAALTEKIKTLFIRLPSLVLLIIFAYVIFGKTSLSSVVICIIALGIKTGSYLLSDLVAHPPAASVYVDLAVAAILIGGASINKASIVNVLVGTFLFQGLLTMTPSVINSILQTDMSEVIRMIVSNGMILYALTRKMKVAK
jgi:hypothetical protein